MSMVMMMNDLRPTIDMYSRAMISFSLLMVLRFNGVDKNVVHRGQNLVEASQAVVVVEPSDGIVHGDALIESHLCLAATHGGRQNGEHRIVGLQRLTLGQIHSQDALLVLLADVIDMQAR